MKFLLLICLFSQSQSWEGGKCLQGRELCRGLKYWGAGWMSRGGSPVWSDMAKSQERGIV